MTPIFRTRAKLCAGLLAVAATLVAGCGSGSATPVASGLSDPQAILTQSFTQIEAATTLHVEGTIDGSLNAGALGAVVGSGSIGLEGVLKVDGSTLSGDIDASKPAAHLSATFPRLFGVTAEVVMVDGFSYVKLSTSSKFTKYNALTSVLAPNSSPGAMLNVGNELKFLKTQLDSGGALATLSGRETVYGRDAYHIVLTIPADMQGRLIGSTGGAAASAADAAGLVLQPVDYWVYVDTLQPARLRLKASSPTLGSLDVSVMLSRYGEPVTIQAPAADQIQG
ncbi:MAG TPA: LppX_LprAFG lipoprotein [Candidatus Limnocylindrales bacterium]